MRVAVVGPCSSGKSTIVDRLREHGFDAYAVSQEHSIIRRLWDHQQPDSLVYLHIDYETVQRRRGAAWPRWIYDAQIERLHDAREHATIVLDTGRINVDETVARIIDALCASA
ncbi:MAG TPA: AAA family ATPase [Nitrolancea sp.]